MKKSYTALYLPSPTSEFTKSGFKTIKSANAYIYTQTKYRRADWLVVDTNVLHKHLDYLEARAWENFPYMPQKGKYETLND